METIDSSFVQSSSIHFSVLQITQKPNIKSFAAFETPFHNQPLHNFLHRGLCWTLSKFSLYFTKCVFTMQKSLIFLGKKHGKLKYKN